MAKNNKQAEEVLLEFEKLRRDPQQSRQDVVKAIRSLVQRVFSKTWFEADANECTELKSNIKWWWRRFCEEDAEDILKAVTKDWESEAQEMIFKKNRDNFLEICINITCEERQRVGNLLVQRFCEIAGNIKTFRRRHMKRDMEALEYAIENVFGTNVTKLQKAFSTVVLIEREGETMGRQGTFRSNYNMYEKDVGTRVVEKAQIKSRNNERS